MKRTIPLLFLVGAASVAQAEDCPLVINQRLQLRYNQWQVDQSPATSTTQVSYEVETGLPVFTYRLGSLNLNGGVAYNRLSIGTVSGSDTGVSHYGASLALFPYRPFHITLDYQRSQSPDILGSGSVKGDTWGAGIRYSNRILGDTLLQYRHGASRLQDGTQGFDYRDDWSLWKLENHHRFPSTRIDFQASRHEYTGQDQTPWKFFSADLSTDSRLGRNGVFATNTAFQDTGLFRSFNVGVHLSNPLTRAWNLYSQWAVGGYTWDANRTSTSLVAESLSYQVARWSAHATASFTQSDTRLSASAGPVPEDVNRMGSFMMGGSYAFATDWQVHGDAALSNLRQSTVMAGSSRNNTSFNLGVARGGDVPGLIRHSLFFLSDWSFNRQVRAEYPPEFVPSELARELMQRRMRQSGNFGFTADLWRMNDSFTEGTMDWARITGQVTTLGGLQVNLMGDFRNDKGMSLPGAEIRSTDLTLFSSYRMGASSLTASIAYNNAHQAMGAQTTLSAPGLYTLWVGPDSSRSSRSYSAGLNTKLGKVPFSVMLMRYVTDLTPATTLLSTWTDMAIGNVAFRISYHVSRTDGGFHSKAVTVDLVRWFDTICVRNWR